MTCVPFWNWLFFVNGIKFRRIISFMIETFKITIYQIGAGQGWWLSKGPSYNPPKWRIWPIYRIDEKIKTSGHILHFTIYTSRWLTKDEEKWIIKLWLRFNIQLGVMMIAQHFILQKNCQKVQQFNEVSSQGNLLNTLHYKLF